MKRVLSRKVRFETPTAPESETISGTVMLVRDPAMTDFAPFALSWAWRA